MLPHLTGNRKDHVPAPKHTWQFQNGIRVHKSDLSSPKPRTVSSTPSPERRGINTRYAEEFSLLKVENIPENINYPKQLDFVGSCYQFLNYVPHDQHHAITVKIAVYPEDNTMSAWAVHDPNFGTDLKQILQRGDLVPPLPNTWKSVLIGTEVSIQGITITILSIDNKARKFYSTNGIEQPSNINFSKEKTTYALPLTRRIQESPIRMSSPKPKVKSYGILRFAALWNTDNIVTNETRLTEFRDIFRAKSIDTESNSATEARKLLNSSLDLRTDIYDIAPTVFSNFKSHMASFTPTKFAGTADDELYDFESYQGSPKNSIETTVIQRFAGEAVDQGLKINELTSVYSSKMLSMRAKKMLDPVLCTQRNLLSRRTSKRAKTDKVRGNFQDKFQTDIEDNTLDINSTSYTNYIRTNMEEKKNKKMCVEFNISDSVLKPNPFLDCGPSTSGLPSPYSVNIKSKNSDCEDSQLPTEPILGRFCESTDYSQKTLYELNHELNIKKTPKRASIFKNISSRSPFPSSERIVSTGGKLTRQSLSSNISQSDMDYKRYFNIHFYLEDNTIEIVEKYACPRSRDDYEVFMRRSVVGPERPKPTFSNNKVDYVTPIQPEEFQVGENILIQGQKYFIYDSDDFTRDYFKKNFSRTLGNAIKLDIPKAIADQWAKAIPNSRESSVASTPCESDIQTETLDPLADIDPSTIALPFQSSYTNLEPSEKPLLRGIHTIGILGEEKAKKAIVECKEALSGTLKNSGIKYLRFVAHIENDSSSGIFIILFHIATCQVTVYSQPNKDQVAPEIILGPQIFMEEIRGSSLQPHHFGIGKVIKLNNTRFCLTDMDEDTRRYLKRNCGIDFYELEAEVVIISLFIRWSEQSITGAKVFVEMDKDRDGKVSHLELLQFLKVKGFNCNSIVTAQILYFFDISKNGSISRDDLYERINSDIWKSFRGKSSKLVKQQLCSIINDIKCQREYWWYIQNCNNHDKKYHTVLQKAKNLGSAMTKNFGIPKKVCIYLLAEGYHQIAPITAIYEALQAHGVQTDLETVTGAAEYLFPDRSMDDPSKQLLPFRDFAIGLPYNYRYMN